MLPVEFHSEARRDFDESWIWYASKDTAAAIRFIASMETALASIAEDPSRFENPEETYCEMPLKKFPFRVIYRFDDIRIVVIAIAHTRRRPRFWQDRS
jgi:toxin ParE1/3/4